MKQLMPVVDPHGIIARIRARMPHDCAVRKSKYCDYIISLRMQGIAYEKIRDWLYDKDPQSCIPTPTLARNLSKAIRAAELSQPFGEEIAEKWGGNIELDLLRELATQIVVQRRRLDAMVRAEELRRKDKAQYANYRIRQEMDTLTQMFLQYQKLLKDVVEPGGAEKNTSGLEAAEERPTLKLDGATEEMLVEAILTGRVSITLPDPDAGDDNARSSTNTK